MLNLRKSLRLGRRDDRPDEADRNRLRKLKQQQQLRDAPVIETDPTIENLGLNPETDE